jgi:hypothetical protein
MAAACQVSSRREGTNLNSHISNSHTERSFMLATATQRGGPNSRSSNSSRDITPKAHKCRNGAIREGRLRRHRHLLRPASRAMRSSPDKVTSSNRDTTGSKLLHRPRRSAKAILSTRLVLSNSNSQDHRTSSRARMLGLAFPSAVRASSRSRADGNLPSSDSINNSSREALVPGPTLH